MGMRIMFEDELTEVEKAGLNGEVQAAGRMILNANVFKRKVGGKTEVVEVCETENQRVAALKKWFGIILSEEQKLGIQGRASELVAVN